MPRTIDDRFEVATLAQRLGIEGLNVDTSPRIAIVTGSSEGIGRETASHLLRAGTAVVLNGRRADVLAETARLLGEAYPQMRGRIMTVAGDVGEREIATLCRDAAIELGGKIDILVNTVGGSSGPRDSVETDAEIMMQSYRVNVITAAEMCRAVVPEMKRVGYGRIVTVASIAAGGSGTFGGAEYAASKAAIIGWTKHLARSSGSFGIVVNCIAPGVILTTRVRQRLEQRTTEEQMELLRGTPVGRHGTPADVAAAIVFLASAEAAFINGAVLEVSGGRFL